MAKNYWLQDNLDNLNEFHSLEIIKKDNKKNVFLIWGSETSNFNIEMEEKWVEKLQVMYQD